MSPKTTPRADAPAAPLSRSFAKGDPITLDIPPGPHTIAVTAWADASATAILGAGCATGVDFQPGAQICLDVDVEAVDLGVSLGDATLPPDMTGRIDGGNVCPEFADFCDDFEDGLYWFPGREESGPGLIAADGVRPYHANLSLHAQTQADPTDASSDLFNRERAKAELIHSRTGRLMQPPTPVARLCFQCSSRRTA